MHKHNNKGISNHDNTSINGDIQNLQTKKTVFLPTFYWSEQPNYSKISQKFK